MDAEQQAEYDRIARGLERKLNESSSLLTFSVKDFNAHMWSVDFRNINPAAYREYAGEDPPSEESLMEWWSQMFSVSWHIRITGKKLMGRQYIARTLIEDAMIDVVSLIAEPAADAVRQAVLAPDTV